MVATQGPGGPRAVHLRSAVAIVGGGPAGIAAALVLAKHGLTSTVLDSEQRPGGQYWRHGQVEPGDDDWARLSTALRTRERDGLVRRLQRHRVWRVDTDRARGRSILHCLSGEDRDSRPVTVSCDALVLATGAQERVLPFPGWDLPGILTPGAVQALLTEHAVVAGTRMVIGGAGPFLLSIGREVVQAGGNLTAVVDAVPLTRWLPHLPAIARNPDALSRFLRMRRFLTRGGVRVRQGQAIVEAHGRDRVEAVTIARLQHDWSIIEGSQELVACDAVAVGWGFVPRIDLAVQAGCRVLRSPHGELKVASDAAGRTSVPRVFVAGELRGVSGARSALVEGVLAGVAATQALTTQALTGRTHASTGTPSSQAIARLIRANSRLSHLATAMESVCRPGPAWPSWIRSDTTVCRCEEVPSSALDSVVDLLDKVDLPTVRRLSRCGMGWCQGKMCEDGVALLARHKASLRRKTWVAERPPLSRPVSAPVPLGLLADQAADPDRPVRTSPT